jgi:hypothetical protein
MNAGNAWYSSDRIAFINVSIPSIVGHLASAAVAQGLHVEPDQHDEWLASVGILQRHLTQRAQDVALLRETLSAPDLAPYRYVILEYDFRRRGLRLDCVLLGDGIIAVLEFKRHRLTAADRDQVTTYCINLVEFHEETRRVVGHDKVIVVPILAQTSVTGGSRKPWVTATFHRPPWDTVIRDPIQAGAHNLHQALSTALSARRSGQPIDPLSWLASRFAPSSTILDAAISLYGQHDVSAIAAHSAPVERIHKCTAEVARWIDRTIKEREKRVIFVSGAPGAGKTLVGLQLAFDKRFRHDAVFVTGNAPLVDVLSEALKRSYRGNISGSMSVLSGYVREDAKRVIDMATFKIVKAHTFLGQRGSMTGASDGRVVVFDEAQRTYQAGRIVLRKSLEADEAELILSTLEQSYGGEGVVVVALVGHKQAINRGELGISAWFKAAEAKGWRFAIGDETMQLGEVEASGSWAEHPNRDVLNSGHLPHSLRFFRNGYMERWAEFVLSDDPASALLTAGQLDRSGDTVWLFRDLTDARAWVRHRRVGDERAGIVASGQARRLAAEGLFVDFKPDIANWMLAPTGDVRSSNMLETVQNQYQIQGLELDYTIVCWDADLRWEGNEWRSYRMMGAEWRPDTALDVAKNGYRVLLTRARKGMVIFVPHGDPKGVDETRLPTFYDSVADHLLACGARLWDAY